MSENNDKGSLCPCSQEKICFYCKKRMCIYDEPRCREEMKFTIWVEKVNRQVCMCANCVVPSQRGKYEKK